MKKKAFYRKIKGFLMFWGFDPRIFIYNFLYFPSFLIDFWKFKRKSGKNAYMRFGKLYPVLGDRKKQGGTLTDHYFYQDLIVARKVFLNNPEKHIDIGSRVDGFVAHVASFREIEVFDIRPIGEKIPNVKFVQADFMDIAKEMYEYTDSVSSLHAIEHFGLGRYGDPLDPSGHLKGIHSISKVLRKGGKFYLSVPIGTARVEFNAHRVFGLKYLLGILKEGFEVDSFSFIDDNKALNTDVVLTQELIDSDCGCRFGCGIFELTKIKDI
jgi:hypothetical protein